MYWTDDDNFHMYRRKLPHWRVKDGVYFVTFRLADSIPQAVLDAWRDEQRTWFTAHGLSSGLAPAEWQRRYDAIPSLVRAVFEREQTRKYFVELDRGHGACQLRHREASGIVAGTLRFYDGSRLRCGDFVVMPNHVHWLVQPLGEELLEKLLQSIKQFSCKRINACLGRTGTLWQKESYDHVVRDSDELCRIREYIKNNPTKAHLNPETCVYYNCGFDFMIGQ